MKQTKKRKSVVNTSVVIEGETGLKPFHPYPVRDVFTSYNVYGGMLDPPPAFKLLIKRELRKENVRIAHAVTKQIIPDFSVLSHLRIFEVRSMTYNSHAVFFSGITFQQRTLQQFERSNS